jgi:hypothetical protein
VEGFGTIPIIIMSAVSTRRIKSSITEKIIEMHHKGYVLDFHVGEDPSIICLQDNVAYSQDKVQIIVIDQCFDRMSKRFQYIHTIETACGRKGLLLNERIYASPQ